MKIVKVFEHKIVFDNGFELASLHRQDCGELHYVDFNSISGQGYEGKTFSPYLNELVHSTAYGGDKYNFETTFIKLQDTEGGIYVLNIYNSNNGYYGSDVDLVMTEGEYNELHPKGYTQLYRVQGGRDDD